MFVSLDRQFTELIYMESFPLQFEFAESVYTERVNLVLLYKHVVFLVLEPEFVLLIIENSMLI